MSARPQTSFAASNPFGMAKPQRKKREAFGARIDVGQLRIGTAPPPSQRAKTSYVRLFEQLPMNHCIECVAADTRAVAQSLRNWARAERPGTFVTYDSKCDDGVGRVWLESAPAKPGRKAVRPIPNRGAC